MNTPTAARFQKTYHDLNKSGTDKVRQENIENSHKIVEGLKHGWNDVINVVQAWFPAEFLDKMRFGNMSKQDVKQALALIKERLVEERIGEDEDLARVADKIQNMLNSNSLIMTNKGKRKINEVSAKRKEITANMFKTDSNLEEFNKIDPDKIKTGEDFNTAVKNIKFKEETI